MIAPDPLVRSGLVALLGFEPDFSILAPGESPDAAELALWDGGASGRAGSLPRVPTLALVRDEESAADVLRAGALGVLLRDAEGDRLIASLRAIAAGVGVFEPALLRGLLGARTPYPDNDAIVLTPREAEVLALMAEGLSNKLIADRLKISDHTAKFHVNSILTKLSAETRTEAVVVAARRGLLML